MFEGWICSWSCTRTIKEKVHVNVQAEGGVCPTADEWGMNEFI